MAERPKTVDEYLASVESPAARACLERLRAILREELPLAEEVIAYGIPTFKLGGYVASFAAFKNHCSFFPGHTVRDFADQLMAYETSKGTVRFPHDRPLPDSLVREMVRARAAENQAAG